MPDPQFLVLTDDRALELVEAVLHHARNNKLVLPVPDDEQAEALRVISDLRNRLKRYQNVGGRWPNTDALDVITMLEERLATAHRDTNARIRGNEVHNDILDKALEREEAINESLREALNAIRGICLGDVQGRKKAIVAINEIVGYALYGDFADSKSVKRAGLREEDR